MYTIGDFLIRIKNAYMVGKKEIVYPYSKAAESIGKILEKRKYVKKVLVRGGSVASQKKGERKELVIELLYNGKEPALSDVKIISRPSVHVYLDRQELAKTLRSHKTDIVSTSSGIMTGEEAKKIGIGGELICEVR